ncbi:MAG: tRNA (N(6)-L-threonylcarbamoyladenosine(37)-C(2))-methylthiotransferase MtaB [Deltaproteobacteria bacterium]|nr:tRNA (N(6)-L-threonylcarbamoyladenosine(37)-C(2))-methylthiotransferase MtaB [Deltaproteobacteria bacterium]
MIDKKFRIITLGCKVNQYESAFFRERLVEDGWQEAGEDDEAEVIIINTCIVTQKAAYQSRQAIRRAIRENPGGIVAAVGCYAQLSPHELSQIDGIGIIAGNRDKSRLPDIIKTHDRLSGTLIFRKEFEKETSFDFLPIKTFSDRTRAYLKIQDGCQSFCSYCIVPFTRGPCRSLEPDIVIRQCKSLCDNGYREIVLTGVHLGKYGSDLEGDINLKGLLKRVGKESPGSRIRLSSLEPKEIDLELIEMVGSEDWLCRHFHIPLQSGDDVVLQKMNRHYSSKDFAALIKNIKSIIPDAAIGVDIIAGFPGEDDRAFGNTFSLIRDLPVSYLHVFPFSTRKGTRAADLPGQVDQKAIKKRAGDLRGLGKEKRQDFYLSCLGKLFSVLTEGWYSEANSLVKGHSDNYVPVIFPSSVLMKNSMVNVKLKKLDKNGIIGEPME